jgi:YVTN family beta-propeller protein
MSMRITVGLSALLLVPAVAAAGGEAGSSPERVFVVNTGDDSVSLVDLASMEEIRRFQVGRSPYGIAVLPRGGGVAVGIEGEGKVAFFDATDFTPLGEVAIGEMHHDHIALSPDGSQLLVANYHSDDVVIIDPVAMREIARIEGTSAPHVVKYGPLKKLAYVTCKKITGIAIIDPATPELVAFHQINVNPRSLTFSPDESKVYFGSFWVDGFFEMDSRRGTVTRLFALPTPADDSAPREVTYHGVETVSPKIVLAANEGRSYLDAVDVTSGELLDRLTDVSNPCCVERIPAPAGSAVRVLVSNVGDGSLQLVQVSERGRLKTLGRAAVGRAPKRIGFLPAAGQSAPESARPDEIR